MKNYYENTFAISPSQTDFEGKLSVPNAFALFMDAASAHSDEIGVGVYDMAKKNLFWLTAKCKARFFRLPRISECCTLMTFPEKPYGLSTIRDYMLKTKDETLAVAKTQWAVLNTVTGKPIRLDNIYPDELSSFLPTILSEPFARVKEAFPAEPFGTYKITSSDIDIGQHTNNVAYIRILFSLFSTKERSLMPITEMDVSYLHPTYEGETLSFFRYTENNTLFIKGTVNGKTAVLYAIT